MKRLLATLVAVLATWLGLLQPGPAMATPAVGATTPTYNSPHVLAADDSAHFERGPPSTNGQYITYDAIDRRSYGASAHLSAARHGYTTYDEAASCAHAASTRATTSRPAEAINEEHSALHPTGIAAKGADEAAALVRYDPMAASRNLLGQIGKGYAVTPGGRTVSAHAAERIALGGPGRPPTTLGRVDDILNNPTGMKYDPVRDTVKVMQGKDFVVVSGTGPQHIVTVMVR
ncbi:MAG: hypothetical protein ACRCY9_09860 [Phycicoccus sp.]